MDYNKAILNIRQNLEQYIVRYKLKALVIGESGGIDSALCTVLARPVADNLNVTLIGRSLSIETNSDAEKKRGKAIGELFCSDFEEVDLTEVYLNLIPFIDGSEPVLEKSDRVRRGNIKARLRMIYLYNLAQKYRGIVLSTDNYTELLQGFWTLHGDVGDYGMIQNLWKGEVYEMARWLADNELKTVAEKEALLDCVDAVPTDGLGISKSDLEQLGAETYDEVDAVLKSYFNGGSEDEKVKAHPVVQRYLASVYKRENPYNIPRSEICN